MKNTEDKCLTCGKELIQVPNKRKKLYCNTTCKSKSWYKGNKDKAKAWRDARKENANNEMQESSSTIEVTEGDPFVDKIAVKTPKQKAKKTRKKSEKKKSSPRKPYMSDSIKKKLGIK